jgi:hypothetical protein
MISIYKIIREDQFWNCTASVAKKPKKLNIQCVKPGTHETGDTDEIRVPYMIMF